MNSSSQYLKNEISIHKYLVLKSHLNYSAIVIIIIKIIIMLPIELRHLNQFWKKVYHIEWINFIILSHCIELFMCDESCSRGKML